MKLSELEGHVTVPQHIKVFAIIVAMIDSMYYDGEPTELIKRLVRYYGVAL